jgi:hypothetical protein
VWPTSRAFPIIRLRVAPASLGLAPRATIRCQESFAWGSYQCVIMKKVALEASRVRLSLSSSDMSRRLSAAFESICVIGSSPGQAAVIAALPCRIGRMSRQCRVTSAAIYPKAVRLQHRALVSVASQGLIYHRPSFPTTLERPYQRVGCANLRGALAFIRRCPARSLSMTSI